MKKQNKNTLLKRPGTKHGWKSVVSELDRLRNEIKGAREMLRRECYDWAEDHTHAQTVAKRVGVPKNLVEGDSYGVPGIQDLIDMIADRIPPKQ